MDYDARHILPFLVDIFSSAPRTVRVAWWGARADTLARFARVWAELGFINPVIVDGTVPNGAGFHNASQLEAATGDYIFEHCEAYIFDFGDCSTPIATLGLAKAMVRALASEYGRMKDPKSETTDFCRHKCNQQQVRNLLLLEDRRERDPLLYSFASRLCDCAA